MHFLRNAKLGSSLIARFPSLHKPPNHDHGHHDVNHDHKMIIKSSDSKNTLNVPPTNSGPTSLPHTHEPSEFSIHYPENGSSDHLFSSSPSFSLEQKAKNIIKPAMKKLSGRIKISPRRQHSSNSHQTNPTTPTAPPEVTNSSMTPVPSHRIKISPPWKKISRRIKLSPRRQHSSNSHQTTPTAPPEVTNPFPSHPIAQVFREEQLGRNVFLLVMPMATGFMMFYNPAGGSVPLPGHLAAGALCVGSAAIWIGMLLRRTWPRASNASELLGVALVLVTMFGLLGSRLPLGYLWLPVLCVVVSLVPLGFALLSSCRDTTASDNGGESGLGVPAAMAQV